MSKKIKTFESQSQSQSKSNHYSQNSQQKLNLYNCIIQYRSFTQLPDLKKQEETLVKFVQHLKNKILFVFGPSGSGKHIFVNSFLQKHQIPYEYRSQMVSYNCNVDEIQIQNLEINQNSRKIKSLRQQIIQSISKTNLDRIQIYEDFPTVYPEISKRQLEALKSFQQKFFSKIANAQCKIIFILNSQIYNKYYLLKNRPQEVMQIVLKPYTITQVKSILKDFTYKHSDFDWVMRNKDVLDQIIEISNGDMRKVLLNVFKQTLDRQLAKTQFRSKEQKQQYKLKLKNDQKFLLFHMLGKFLYAKRYDQIQKKDRVFTRKQLIETDPPFYFNPVKMYEKSLVPLRDFTDLLFQNYLMKIAAVQDASQITRIFSHLDATFPYFITNKRIDSISEESQKLYIFLLTWGIILKNKSSSLIDKKFTSFKKSLQRAVNAQIQTKHQLLKKYFPYSSLSSLVHWGHIVKNSKPTKQYLIANIIKRRLIAPQFLRDQNEKLVAQQEQEELAKQSEKVYDIQFISSYNKKRKAKEAELRVLRQIQMENQDSSDIDD